MRDMSFIKNPNNIRIDGYYYDSKLGISIKLTGAEVLYLRDKFHDKYLAHDAHISDDAVMEFFNVKASENAQRRREEEARQVEMGKRGAHEAPRRESRSNGVYTLSPDYSSPYSKTASKAVKQERQQSREPEVLEPIRVQQRSQSPSQQRPQQRTTSRVTSPTTGRPYAVDRSNKYNNGKNKGKKSSGNGLFKRIVIAGVVVMVFIGGFNIIKGNDKDNVVAETPNTTIVQMNDERLGMDAPDESQYVVLDTIQQEVKNLVDHYAQVFSVNADMAYKKLVDLTGDFSSSQFINEMTCDQLSCKGTTIYADSLEEFVIYYMRIIKQDPERYGLSGTEVQTSYDSGTNYDDLITHYCEVMKEDPCLIYAIMKAETGFSSEALMDLHNPCGLMIDGEHLWSFDSLEAGLIEMIAQVKQYRYKGANTIEAMGDIHCPVGADNDPYHLNENWVSNVIDGYRYAFDNQEELFGQRCVESSMLGGPKLG